MKYLPESYCKNKLNTSPRIELSGGGHAAAETACLSAADNPPPAREGESILTAR